MEKISNTAAWRIHLNIFSTPSSPPSSPLRPDPGCCQISSWWREWNASRIATLLSPQASPDLSVVACADVFTFPTSSDGQCYEPPAPAPAPASSAYPGQLGILSYVMRLVYVCVNGWLVVGDFQEERGERSASSSGWFNTTNRDRVPRWLKASGRDQAFGKREKYHRFGNRTPDPSAGTTHTKLALLPILLLLLLILNLFSPINFQVAVFCGSGSQQEIKAIFPRALYECYVQCSLVWYFVSLWPTGDLETTEVSDLIPSYLFLIFQL
jgi:hypothetical protein